MSSYGRTKVLTIMLETGELNISEITRRSGLSHSAATRHLEFLTKSGILTEKRFNRIRIFRVDQSSPVTAALLRFYADWKEIREAMSLPAYN
jgi:DNA-binding transcriptional ArsR family regulator